MQTLDKIRVVTQFPGRARLSVPSLYRSPDAASAIEALLSRQPGVCSAQANPLTARVLLVFDPALSLADLLPRLGLGACDGPDRPQAVRPAATAKVAGPSLYAPWHLREADEALAFFDSSSTRGLGSAEASQRLQNGANTLPPPAPVSSFKLLLDQFKSPPVVLLGVSVLISIATGGLAEAAAIAAVLALNGGIGFATERRAASTIASLSELVDDTAFVLRAGSRVAVEVAAVVPGDILLLDPGVRVAADARLLSANELAVDESTLTGESLAVDKQAEPLPAPRPLAERSNMVFRGTTVAAGEGKALVVGTGIKTEAGAVEGLTTGTVRPKTPMQRQLEQLSNQLVVASSVICVGIFGLGLVRGMHWLAILKTSLSLAIAAVPEGLPAAATTSLARGLRRMRDQGVLMRSLRAVENIGAIDTICLDKTGTLTLNKMSVVTVQTAFDTVQVSSATAPLAGAPATTAATLERLLQVCVLCNQAQHEGDDGGRAGSPTEQALLALARQAGVQPAELRARYSLLQTRLRATGRNTMRMVHLQRATGKFFVAVKGNPAEVLAMASQVAVDGGSCALDEPFRTRIAQQNEQMAQRRLRVLGFAFAETDAEPDPERMPELSWLGLVGMADPLRPGVDKTMARFHAAGIRTIMLTGDQRATAYEIGRELHLNNGADIQIVDAQELSATPVEHVQDLVANVHIFARVSPSDKLHIVKTLQGAGRTVAMTGDGVNDGPALRAADVGIAMGGGTDAALSVADIALKDDKLDSLLDAVSQGRMIAANMEKSLHFLLSSNLSEILVVLGGVVAAGGQPLTPLQLLWLNLLSDLLPAIALAAEPPEHDVMSRPPRPSGQAIVGRTELWRYAREAGWLAAGALGAYFIGTGRYGHGARAGTIAFNTMVLGQLLHAVACRSDRHHAFISRSQAANPGLNLAIAGSFGLQLLANLVPGLRRLLGIVPLGGGDILVTLAGAGLPLLLNEWQKGRAMQRS